ncbi:cache domain-containing protein [Salipiger mangrovisoli]|uniref:Cache domain-containing protein n=1 Tax=Salipiger mangrovisoli TaxID=2865933 RepID=A0ABR9X3F0_9RHOB|nr:cache domain-containing protein [Salipiger mangrovisoli]MBE9638104.1 cache domain-containing protein [Salipiger mangrovisoli]
MNTTFLGILGFVLVTATAAAIFGIRWQAQEYQVQLQRELGLRGAQALAQTFNKAISREWDSLRAVASRTAYAEAPEMQEFANAVVRAGGQIAWVGFASPDGVIIAGSRGERLGDDVSQRNWFRAGFSGETVGSAYTKNEGTEEEVSLINLSMPVKDSFGDTQAVAVYSVRISWVAEYMEQAAQELDLSAIIRDRKGQTLVDTRPEAGTDLPARVEGMILAGRPDADRTRLHRSDAGHLYAVLPNFTLDTMPGFGWTLIVDVRADAFGSAFPQFLRNINLILMTIGLGVLLSTLLLFHHLTRPFLRLIRTATALADGQMVYPREEQATRESMLLSAVLARLQTQIQSLRAKP